MIDMDLVVELVQKLSPDVPIMCAMSGGNCATIYMGDPYGPDPEHPELYPVLGGPGNYGHRSTAWPEEFSIGYDQDYPDVSIDGWDLDGSPEPLIAERMVKLYRKHPRVIAGEIK